MKYQWKALSSLILLITILKALMEFLMDPEKILCIGPDNGPKTAKADDSVNMRIASSSVYKPASC